MPGPVSESMKTLRLVAELVDFAHSSPELLDAPVTCVDEYGAQYRIQETSQEVGGEIVLVIDEVIDRTETRSGALTHDAVERLCALARSWTQHSSEVSKFIDGEHSDELLTLVKELAEGHPTTNEGTR